MKTFCCHVKEILSNTCCSLSDITVAFSQTVYSVSEGEGEVVVPISVEGESDILLQFHLEAINNSATCEFLRLNIRLVLFPLFLVAGNDYLLIETLVPLQPPLNNTVEVKIRLINNSVVEDREHFSISIHSNNLQITVPTVSQVADFYILDDDSKSGAINNHKIIFTSISIGLTVGFSSPIYDGREDDNSVAEVCITLSGETERNFMVTLNVNNGTATGQ